MQKDKFTLPYTLRVINTIGAVLRAMRLPTTEFKEETLLRAASKQTGLSDFGDPYFREGLRRLLDSAENDAKLHFLGRMVFFNWVLLQLANRLLLVETMTAGERSQYSSTKCGLRMLRTLTISITRDRTSLKNAC
jgi:hypothetical protein